jgi:hypothetical protein
VNGGNTHEQRSAIEASAIWIAFLSLATSMVSVILRRMC